MSPQETFERYSRQMLVPQIGRQGQERLAAARVGVMGCGALGSVVASHLVRSGVGFVRLVDKDGPELHNLHRQILYTERDVALGVPKVEAAAAFLRAANSEVVIEPVVELITDETLPRLADDLDLLVDGTDNFPTRFAINDYAVSRKMPWVYGGVITTTGMSMTIVPGEGPCLRCLVRELPSPEEAPTAAVAGVLSTIVGIIGSIEANEAIKLIVQPEARSRFLVAVDVWDLSFERLEIPRDPTCPSCGRAAPSDRS
ncbi:MAG: HesA/MoeB/ThiF family protein [Thermoleophilia bacterium]|nr:HesA/MoeB/ThiF family protein [Thermoleophilia bacterium]